MQIRTVSTSDAEQIVRIRRQNGVRKELLALTSERTEEISFFIKSLKEYDRVFVAEKESDIVGMVVILASYIEKRKHSAAIAIMVDEKLHQQGIGSELMKKAIEEADNYLKIRRLELRVLTDNKIAISLYKKYGFQIEATLKNSAVKNGAFVDEFMMARIYKGA